MPWYLGGQGDFYRAMEEHPYAKHKSGLKEYLLIPMGYHLGGFFAHFLNTKKNDFVEMGLHHLVSIYLFGGTYLANQWEGGSVIAMLHDLADITTNIVKILSDTKYKNLAGAYFIL